MGGHTLNKRQILKTGAGVIAATTLPRPSWSAESIAPGPFLPSWDSFLGGYHAPDWFRDAKFGIWAHWSAQCVPEQGDWYAPQMYMQGYPQYQHHLATHGHPSETGFMEINNLWKAERRNPGDLLDLYKKAGARYFVALANHHDNFDNYNSRFHDWNSVRVWPKRDLIAQWSKEARDRGLKFGVSNHSTHAWHWFQTAYGYDPEGQRAGARYDAFRLTKYDGKGKWWSASKRVRVAVSRAATFPSPPRASNAWRAANRAPRWRSAMAPMRPMSPRSGRLPSNW